MYFLIRTFSVRLWYTSKLFLVDYTGTSATALPEDVSVFRPWRGHLGRCPCFSIAVSFHSIYLAWAACQGHIRVDHMFYGVVRASMV